MAYSWKMTPTVLGLCALTVSPGVSGMKRNTGDIADQQRALTETILLGITAAHLTRSWWPLAAPVLYVGFDYAWSQYHGKTPEIGTL